MTSILFDTMKNPFQDLIFYFLIYSFIGWVIEGTYSASKGRRFLKDNFLVGPFKPMYAFAPIIILSLVTKSSNVFYIILISLIVPTLVEFISGVLLKGLFGRVWWDYSTLKYNIKGHICLQFSIYWIGLCFLLIYIVHPFIYSVYQSIYFIWDKIYLFAFLYIAIDFTYTVIKRRTMLSRGLIKE